MRGTVVLLMAVENAGATAEALVFGGRPDNLSAAVVADGSLPTERIVRTTVAQLGRCDPTNPGKRMGDAFLCH